MRLTILQPSLLWEQPEANRTRLARQLAPLAGQTDVIVLPEMFTTGFSMNAGMVAEPLSGPTLKWMQEQAGKLDAAIAGSFICVDYARYYNRLVWMYPDGKYRTYDKRHLFTLAGEEKTYTPGSYRLVLEWKGWRICPMICYDLRFPVWLRQQKGNYYDLMVVVANWPSKRSLHWKTLLEARAIENQAYVAGVNIFGTDGAGLDYTGDSSIIDFSGEVKGRITGQEGFYTADLSLDALREYRRQLPFLNDGDDFNLP